MPRPIGSEKILCLTARSWSNLFACIQIIGSAIGIIVAIALLATLENQKDLLKNNPAQLLKVTGQTFGQGLDSLKLFEEAADQAYLVLLVFECLLLVLSVVGFIMGFILYTGVRQEKPTHLTIWIVFTGLLMVVGVAGAITVSALAQAFMSNTLVFLGNIFINIFSMWVVAKHRTELQELKVLMSQPVGAPTPYSGKI